MTDRKRALINSDGKYIPDAREDMSDTMSGIYSKGILQNIITGGSKGSDLFPDVSSVDGITDDMWVTSSVISGIGRMTDSFKRIAATTNADYKYEDTSLGGNLSINARPSWCPYADPRRGVDFINHLNPDGSTKSLPPSAGAVWGNHGLIGGQGRVYSAQIDDPKQTITMQFGVAKYQPALVFWTSFIDRRVEQAARTGDTSTFAKDIGSWIGSALLLWTFRPIALIGWAIKGVLEWVIGSGGGRFYRVEPTPQIYYSMLNTAVNQYAIYRGLYPSFSPPEYKDGAYVKDEVGQGTTETSRVAMNQLTTLMPNVFTDDWGIDVTAIMARSGSKYVRANAIIEKRAKENSEDSFLDDLISVTKNISLKTNPLISLAAIAGATATSGLSEYITGNPTETTNNETSDDGELSEVAKITISENSNTKTSAVDDIIVKDASGNPELDSNGDVKTQEPPGLTGFLTYAKLFTDYGLAHTKFDVEYTGSVSESFSNASSPSAGAEAFNSASNASRNLRFNISGANVADGVLGGVMDVLGSGLDALGAGVDSFTLGLTSAISGVVRGANIEIANKYESSSVELSGASYTMTLISPEPDIVSQIQHIWLPLFSILTPSLPIKVGPNSNTAPLLCTINDPGRLMYSTAMVSNITISRGEGNYGFDDAGHALSFKVNFDILDLSPILSVPISTGGWFQSESEKRLISSDSRWGEYLQSAAAMDQRDREFFFKDVSLNKALATRNYTLRHSDAAWGHRLSESIPGKFFKAITGNGADVTY